MNNDEHDRLLRRISDILFWSFLMSYAMLILWSLIYLAAGNCAYNTHANLFELSRRDFALVNYYGMAFTKLVAVVLFLFPCLAIKIVLRKKNPKTQ